MNGLPPAIKWTGSKRSQVPGILPHVPDFGRYYEPFIGGGAVVGALAPSEAICGDICAPLVEFWRKVKESPNDMADSYEKRWRRLQIDGQGEFYRVRATFNASPNAEDFLFLSRTCTNGLIRFNKKGEFNNSFHHGRGGISPDTLRSILASWSSRLHGVSFVCGDYRSVTAGAIEGDFVYLDPPYANTRGQYYGAIDYGEFISCLDGLGARGVKYALSFDGLRGDRSYVADLPKHLYKRHLLLESGSSSFRRLVAGESVSVKESLYLNY